MIPVGGVKRGRKEGSVSALHGVPGAAVLSRRVVTEGASVVSLAHQLGRSFSTAVIVRHSGDKPYIHGLYTNDLALAEAMIAAGGGARRKVARVAVEEARRELAISRQGCIDARRAFQVASAPESASTDKDKLDLAVKALVAVDALTEAGERLADAERSGVKKEAETEVVNGILMAMLGQMMKPDVVKFVKKCNEVRREENKAMIGVDHVLPRLPPFLRTNPALRRGWGLELALGPGGTESVRSASTSDKLFHLVSPFPLHPPRPPFPAYLSTVPLLTHSLTHPSHPTHSSHTTVCS